MIRGTYELDHEYELALQQAITDSNAGDKFAMTRFDRVWAGYVPGDSDEPYDDSEYHENLH
jgi:hypothetical protein